MDAATRAELRRALKARYSELLGSQRGPAAVEAGECDACEAEARLITTCGPTPFRYLGRTCAASMGEQAYCEGHAADALETAGWLGRLPSETDLVARLWWVATGEVRLDERAVAADLAALALPAGGELPC
jgi:hypothetical protein